MSYPLPADLEHCDPPVEFIEEVCGIYFRSILVEKEGMLVWQHVHDYDHATYIGSGAARLWVDGVWQADYQAGSAAGIKAGAKHVFQALKPNTRLACVHDARREGH
jgi:quercetin dioxygenase-like cupin family protein